MELPTPDEEAVENKLNCIKQLFKHIQNQLQYDMQLPAEEKVQIRASLVDALRDSDEEVVRWAAMSISELGITENEVDFIVQLLPKVASCTRYSLLLSLIPFGELLQEKAMIFVNMLNDEEFQTNGAVVDSLVMIFTHLGTNAVAELLRKNNLFSQRAYARSIFILSRLSLNPKYREQVIPALYVAKDSTDSLAKGFALEALERIKTTTK